MATPGRSWQSTATRFWTRSYVADYIGFIALVAAYIPVRLLLTPFHRLFSLSDLTKSYPYAPVQLVSSRQNMLISIIIPLSIIIIWTIILRPPIHKSHVTLLGLFTSVILTTLITDIVKNAVGRPRPDLIARCIPAQGTPTNELVSYLVCTQTNLHILRDGFRSFPSGHSSLAFSGLGYLAIFLAGQTRVFRPRADLMSVLVCLIPLVGAGMIAMSRLEDYRHDGFDVIAGSLLGLVIAYLTYRRYYWGLWDVKCFEVYPSKAEMAEKRGMGRNRDEEERLAVGNDFDLSDASDDASEVFPLNNVREEDRDQT